MVRAGIGAAAVVVIVGIGVALVALLGRPAVSVSSGESLVQVHLGGVGTEVTAIRATVLAGRSRWHTRVRASSRRRRPAGPDSARARHCRSAVLAPLAAGLGGLDVGDAPGAVGRAVGGGGRCRAPGAGDAWLRPPGKRHRYPGGLPQARLIRLSRPSATAQLAVPEHQSGGALQVAAAAWPWERLADRPATVDWLEAPLDGVPVAAADPAPASADARLDSPITLTFDESVAGPSVRPAHESRRPQREPGPNRMPTRWCSPRGAPASDPAPRSASRLTVR